MRSLKQSEASRTNGARSHGPVTPEGKARSAANSTTHGLYGQTVVLENEDPTLYQQWLDRFLAAWQPADEHEHHLVRDIVDARWRLRRYSVLETKALDFEVGRSRSEIDEVFVELDEGTRTVFGLTSLLALNRTFEVLQTVLRAQHRIIERASRQLMDRRKARGAAPLTPEFGNEPEPVLPPEQQPVTVEENSGNEPGEKAPVAARPGATPPNWEMEPEQTLTAAAESAMRELLQTMLREKLGPDALASLARLRR